jgi:hypothetical protein
MSPLSPGRSPNRRLGTRRPTAVPVPTRPRATKPAAVGWHPSMGPRPA